MAFIPGYQLKEASDLIALLAHLEGPTPPLKPPPLPPEWKLVFDSPVIGAFDNRWQLMENTKVPGQYAVLIRGTVDTTGSILDDVLAVTIPASGSIFGYDYRFAKTPAGGRQPGVHMGFAMAALILLFDAENGILARLESTPGIQEVILAGHSQGAAIATILGSFFRYYGEEPFSGFAYKTYAFAQPKPGNDLYASDFNAAVGNGGFGIVVNNSEDWVPQAPLTLELLTDLNTPNPISVWERAGFSPLEGAIDLLHHSIKESHLHRQSPQRRLLQDVLHRQGIQAARPGADPAAFPEIMWTLNFAGCGQPYSLLGIPGSNPKDPKDFFWQHHAAMYYDLMNGITPL